MSEQTSHSLVQTLRTIPDFSALDEQTLLQIVGESMNLFWKAGSTIFTEGSPGDALFVILSGEISILDDGKEIGHPVTGHFFGEMSLLMNATHSKKAVALTDSEVLVLPKEAFRDLLAENPKLARHFDEVMRSRQPLDQSDDAIKASSSART